MLFDSECIQAAGKHRKASLMSCRRFFLGKSYKRRRPKHDGNHDVSRVKEPSTTTTFMLPSGVSCFSKGTAMFPIQSFMPTSGLCLLWDRSPIDDVLPFVSALLLSVRDGSSHCELATDTEDSAIECKSTKPEHALNCNCISKWLRERETCCPHRPGSDDRARPDAASTRLGLDGRAMIR